MTVHRIQDRRGSGPFKPGFSLSWVEDREDLDLLLPMLLEVPDLLRIIETNHRKGLHLGHGCRTVEGIRRWITPKEWEALKAFGYRAVRFTDATIVAESQTQVLFTRFLPLKYGAEPFELHP